MGGKSPGGQSLSDVGASEGCVGQRRKAPPGAEGMWGQEMKSCSGWGQWGSAEVACEWGEPGSQCQRGSSEEGGKVLGHLPGGPIATG